MTRRSGGIQAYKLVIPAGSRRREPGLKVHEGHEWVYVLNGRLRLALARHDIVLSPGEAAEFDTRTPHWFGAAGGEAVEFLSLFGKHGERAHPQAGPPGPALSRFAGSPPAGRLRRRRGGPRAPAGRWPWPG